jgi:hypothetical protein
MNKNLLFEISQLKDLNFQIEYEIIKIDSYIINIKQRMNQIKQFDYIREKEKDIFLTSKNEINQIEDEFKLKLLNMKNQYNILKEKEQNIKKDIQNIKEQINKLNEIFQSGKYDKKYIDTSQVIEEDKNEDNTKSITNFTNSFININNNKQFDYSFNDSSYYKQNNNNKMILDNNNLKFQKDNVNSKDYNLKNININMNINVNINLNNNIEKDNTIKQLTNDNVTFSSEKDN